jgi:hypothetical protein
MILQHTEMRANLTSILGILQGQGSTSAANDRGAYTGGGDQGSRVWSTSERASGCGVGESTEIITGGNSVAAIGAVQGLLVSRVPDVVLDQELSSNAGVDTVVVVVEDVVEDMAVAESEGRSARVDVLEVVERIGNRDLGVLRAVAIGMAYKGALPVVVEVRVRDGDASATVSNIQKTIVVVLIVIPVTPELDVVNPNLRGGLNADSIACVSENLVDLQVTDDDVLLVQNAEPDTGEGGTALSNKRGV